MIKNITNYIKSKGIKEYELFYDSSDNISVILNRGKIDFASEGKVEGLGVRVAVGKKLGFSNTLDIKHYKKCVDEAIKIAKLNNQDNKFKSFNTVNGKRRNSLGADKKMLDFGLDNINKYIKHYIENIKNKDEEIVITSGSFVKNTSKTLIVNSEGVDAEKNSCSNMFWAELIKEKGNTLGFSDQSRLPLNPKKAEEHAERFLNTRNKDIPDTKNICLVLHPEALAELIDNSLGFAISSENVQAGKSVLAGKLGERIFDKRITIVDDSTSGNLLCSRPFDDEGVPSMKTVIAENGVLKNYLYDSYHANVDGKKSTSSAVRSYNSLPEISFSNLLIKKGNKSKNSILNSVDKCIYVKQLMGAHAMDATTGNFSLSVLEGHIYNKGEMQHPVKDTMIAGNFYNLLNSVLAVGNKLMHAGSGFYLPVILCDKVKVIGK